MNTAKTVEPQEYAATYKGGKFGKTTVHIVAPQITAEENQRRWGEVMKAAWNCWDTLTTEEKLQINAECEAGLLE
jgi:hypothetical protein